LEKFLNLSMERQNDIINAALRAFGANGYKKASIRDIAMAAGISKSMIFHYFGTKKDLYLFLVEHSGKMLMEEMSRNFDEGERDFFERVRLASEIKISVMKKHPAILSFLKSVYLETEEEIAQEIKAIMAQGEAFRSNIALNRMDASKFKEGIDPLLVMKMLVWFAEGYASQLGLKVQMDIDDITREFNQCLNMLKQNFYKEEFL
jgi:TetR/AcrR family transcriptional regulator